MPWLLPARVRADVRVLGRFVRLAEGVAASPMLSRSQRYARLVALEAMLDARSTDDGDRTRPGSITAATRCSSAGRDEAVIAALRASLVRRDIPAASVRTILRTLEQTVTGSTPGGTGSRGDGNAVAHATWADVVAYGAGAAAPIGRHLLALIGEDPIRCGPPADALCIAMRILKTLRDCDGPSEPGALPCIPATYMHDASITTRHLSAPSARGQTRAVLDRVLDGVDALLSEAGPLPLLIENRRLRTYVRVVFCRASKLSARCRRGDPLREKVELSGWERQACVWRNLLRDLVRR